MESDYTVMKENKVHYVTINLPRRAAFKSLYLHFSKLA